MPSLSKRRFSENNLLESTDLLFASIADISARVRNGRLSPVELAQHCLDRIEALNPILNAFITVTAPLALDQAGNAGTEIRAGHPKRIIRREQIIGGRYRQLLRVPARQKCIPRLRRPQRSCRTRRKSSSNAELPNCGRKSQPHPSAAITTVRNSFTRNSSSTKPSSVSPRTIHHQSLEPLGRKNRTNQPRCPIGPHPRKSEKPLTSFAAHWDGRSKMKISELADQVRDIPLRDVLERYGFEPKPEGTTLRAKSKHHNIVVTGNQWFDNKANIGGGGAIDLVMHIAGVDFLAACRSLADQFRPLAAGQSGLSFPSSSQRQPRARRRNPSRNWWRSTRLRDDSNWPIARAYLVEQRKISAGLVDELHASGSIYANDHRPNPSLVFLHRDQHGEVRGATLRDTKHQSAFRPCLGNKLTAWFAVGDLAEAERVVAVESPIDALSYYCLFAGAPATRWQSSVAPERPCLKS